MTSFSENLKRLRLERKMTQDELAELLKTSKQEKVREMIWKLIPGIGKISKKLSAS